MPNPPSAEPLQLPNPSNRGTPPLAVHLPHQQVRCGIANPTTSSHGLLGWGAGAHRLDLGAPVCFVVRNATPPWNDPYFVGTEWVRKQAISWKKDQKQKQAFSVEGLEHSARPFRLRQKTKKKLLLNISIFRDQAFLLHFYFRTGGHPHSKSSTPLPPPSRSWPDQKKRLFLLSDWVALVLLIHLPFFLSAGARPTAGGVAAVRRRAGVALGSGAGAGNLYIVHKTVEYQHWSKLRTQKIAYIQSGKDSASQEGGRGTKTTGIFIASTQTNRKI